VRQGLPGGFRSLEHSMENFPMRCKEDYVFKSAEEDNTFSIFSPCSEPLAAPPAITVEQYMIEAPMWQVLAARGRQKFQNTSELDQRMGDLEAALDALCVDFAGVSSNREMSATGAGAATSS
jgi:hypothetical protein